MPDRVFVRPVMNAVALSCRTSDTGGGSPGRSTRCHRRADIRENGVDFAWHGFKKVLQKLPGGLAIGFLDQLHDRKLAGSVNGKK